jgi:hypothetical protein
MLLCTSLVEHVVATVYTNGLRVPSRHQSSLTMVTFIPFRGSAALLKLSIAYEKLTWSYFRKEKSPFRSLRSKVEALFKMFS